MYLWDPLSRDVESTFRLQREWTIRLGTPVGFEEVGRSP